MQRTKIPICQQSVMRLTEFHKHVTGMRRFVFLFGEIMLIFSLKTFKDLPRFHHQVLSTVKLSNVSCLLMILSQCIRKVARYLCSQKITITSVKWCTFL